MRLSDVTSEMLYRSRLGFSGSGSRETSDSELSRTNLRSVPRLRTFLTGRGIPYLKLSMCFIIAF